MTSLPAPDSSPKPEPVSHGVVVPAGEHICRVSLPSDNLLGEVLSGDQRDVLSRQAQLGLAKLQQVPLASRDADTLGIESELHLVGPDGSPLGVGREVIADFNQQPCVTRSQQDCPPAAHGTLEFGKNNAELNITAVEPGPNCIKVTADRLHEALSVLSESAERLNAKAVLVGILPSMLRRHLGISAITENPRFYNLDVALSDSWQRSWRDNSGKRPVKYNFEAGQERYTSVLSQDLFYMEGPLGKIELEMAHKVRYGLCNTSFQIHYGIADQSRYSYYHALAELLVPLMVGVCANSSVFDASVTGSRELRAENYIAALDPRRVFTDKSWNRHPLDQIKQAAAAEPLLTKGFKDRSLTAEDLQPIEALRQLHKTTWPFVRTVWDFNRAGELVFRIEFRPIPTGPTHRDNMAALTLFVGLMEGMQDYFTSDGKGISFEPEVTAAQIDKHLPYKVHVRENLLHACRRGLQANILWFDGERVTLRDLLCRLMPYARAGLEKRGIDPKTTAPYLETIERRLNYSIHPGRVGVTPADVQLHLFTAPSADDPETRSQNLSLFLAQAHQVSLKSGEDLLQIFDRVNPLKFRL